MVFTLASGRRRRTIGNTRRIAAPSPMDGVRAIAWSTVCTENTMRLTFHVSMVRRGFFGVNIGGTMPSITSLIGSITLKVTSAKSADAPPLAHQQRATEQIGPDFHAIEAPFVVFRANADQRRGVGKQRQLHRHRTYRTGLRAFGHLFMRNVSQRVANWQRKPPTRTQDLPFVLHYWL
jgi:hypothetical protein